MGCHLTNGDLWWLRRKFLWWNLPLFGQFLPWLAVNVGFCENKISLTCTAWIFLRNSRCDDTTQLVFLAFGYLVLVGWLVGWAFLPINYCSFLSLQSCREKKRIMAQFWAFNGRYPLFAFLTAGRKDLEIAAFHRRSNSKLNISWLDASLLLVQHSRCRAQKNITFLSSHQGRNWWGHLVMIPSKEVKMGTFYDNIAGFWW